MLLESGQKILYTNGCASVTGVDTVKGLDMTGNSNFKYYVLVNVDGKVLNVRASNGTYSYALKASNPKNDLKIENIEVEDNNQETLDSDITSSLCPTEEDTYSPHIATCVEEGCTKTQTGIELIIAGENFYVVSSDAANTVLLAKYDLKQDGSSYSQDTSGNSTNIVKADLFDSNNTAYWDNYEKVLVGSDWVNTNSTGGLKSPYSDNGASYCSSSSGTNCAYVYDENAVNIYPVVESYARKISTSLGTSISGRLMSLEEANSLDANIRKDINSYWYWLGSANYNYIMWSVNTYGNFCTDGPHRIGGVRPVIIVNTSDL